MSPLVQGGKLLILGVYKKQQHKARLLSFCVKKRAVFSKLTVPDTAELQRMGLCCTSFL